MRYAQLKEFKFCPDNDSIRTLFKKEVISLFCQGSAFYNERGSGAELAVRGEKVTLFVDHYLLNQMPIYFNAMSAFINPESNDNG